MLYNLIIVLIILSFLITIFIVLTIKSLSKKDSIPKIHIKFSLTKHSFVEMDYEVNKFSSKNKKYCKK